MSTAALEQAIAATRGVLTGVKRDQLGSDTPCASWTVGELINHIVSGQYFFVAMVEGKPPAEGNDYSGGDFVAAFDDGAAKSVAAFNGDGVMEKILTLPFGQMPGSAFVGIAATDTFTHGWDLARATGQSTDLDPQLAAGLLAGAKQFISDGIRGDEPMPFAAEQKAPSGATNADELAAFLGRRV